MTVTEFAIQHIQLLTIAHTNMLVENIMGLWGNNYPDTSGWSQYVFAYIQLGDLGVSIHHFQRPPNRLKLFILFYPQQNSILKPNKNKKGTLGM